MVFSALRHFAGCYYFARFAIKPATWVLADDLIQGVEKTMCFFASARSADIYPVIASSFAMLLPRGVVLPLSQLHTLFADTPSFAASSF